MSHEEKDIYTERPAGPFVETAIRLAALGILLYWSLVLIRPFLSIVIWSVVLAVALYPIFEWIAMTFGGRRRLAAAFVTVSTLLVVVGPAIWITLGMIDSVRTILEHVDISSFAIPAPPQSIKSWPVIGDPIYQFWILASTNSAAALAKIMPQVKPLASGLLLMGANAGLGMVKFLAAIVVSGFLLSPAPMLVDATKEFAQRLNPLHGPEFVIQAAATIKAVARGVIGISVLQALLAGIGLMIAGIPQANLITLGVLILGIVQIGPSILIIPTIIWGWTLLDTQSALFFTAYMIPVNLIDNVLRPIVMGRGLKTPMPVIFIGVLGGTLAYGITGLFLGPIVLAVIWELLLAWVKQREVVPHDQRF